MATSRCPKCGSTFFEMEEGKIQGSKFRLLFIQCGSCGTVVGVQELFNISNLIYKLAKKLNINLDN